MKHLDDIHQLYHILHFWLQGFHDDVDPKLTFNSPVSLSSI